MTDQNNQLAPEDQVKQFKLSYAQWCLLVDVVGVRAGSPMDFDGRWTSLYKQLVGEA